MWNTDEFRFDKTLLRINNIYKVWFYWNVENNLKINIFFKKCLVNRIDLNSIVKIFNINVK